MATPKQPEPSGHRHVAEGELGPAGTDEGPHEPEVVGEPSWAGGPQYETGAREARTGWDTHPSDRLPASAESGAADRERTSPLALSARLIRSRDSGKRRGLGRSQRDSPKLRW